VFLAAPECQPSLPAEDLSVSILTCGCPFLFGFALSGRGHRRDESTFEFKTGRQVYIVTLEDESLD